MAHEKVHVICENLCLEEGMTKEQINNLVNTTKNTLRDEISVVASGSPKGVYVTSAALKTANPDTGVYLASSDGHIYSWTKNQSEDPLDLGVYQATEIARESVLNNMLKGKITDDKRDFGNNLTYLATSVLENKRMTGYSTSTYTPQTTNQNNYNVLIFNVSDLLNFGEYFEIAVPESLGTQCLIEYTENTDAYNVTRSKATSSTYNYDSEKGVYYFKLRSNYEKVAITFSSNHEVLIPMQTKAEYIKQLEAYMKPNQNNIAYNIKNTNILEFANEILFNTILDGYSTSTFKPNFVDFPYNNIAIFNTADIPKALYEQIYYLVNTNTNLSQLIVGYNEGRSAANIGRSQILSSSDYNSETGYYKIPSSIFNNYEKVAISINPFSTKYNLYSNLWNEGNPNYINFAEIILPSKIYGLANHDYMIYYNNCLKYANYNKLQIARIDGNGTERYNDFGNINTNANTPITYSIYKDSNNEETLSKTTQFIATPENAGSGKTKKVLFIGDSLTDADKYTEKLYDLFQNDVMNIEMLGTRGVAPHNMEGRFGWRAYTYVNCANGTDDGMTTSRTNPFYNPSTHIFDFTYYMSNQNYSGVDYVFICLGTNDTSKGNHKSEADIISYYNTMINSIKAYNSNIKIVLWIPPSRGTYNKMINNGTNNGYVYNMHEYLIRNYDNNQVPNVYLMNAGLMLNPEKDFTISRKTFLEEEIEYVSDPIHPLTSGYNKIAYAIYYMIKYLGSLNS